HCASRDSPEAKSGTGRAPPTGCGITRSDSATSRDERIYRLTLDVRESQEIRAKVIELAGNSFTPLARRDVRQFPGIEYASRQRNATHMAGAESGIPVGRRLRGQACQGPDRRGIEPRRDGVHSRLVLDGDHVATVDRYVMPVGQGRGAEPRGEVRPRNPP